MAASIWQAMRWLAACAYCATSTRDTTPLVTLVLSPPVGLQQAAAGGAGVGPSFVGCMQATCPGQRPNSTEPIIMPILAPLSVAQAAPALLLLLLLLATPQASPGLRVPPG